MDIRLSYLKTFLAAAETGNFSRAAEKLGITQGTISNHIAALEDFFDTQLFFRTIEGVELTDEGKIVLKRTRDIFDTLNKVQTEIGEIRGVPKGTIRVVASTIPGEHILPSIISGFRKKHPQITFEIVEISDSARALGKLRADDADIACVGTLDLTEIEKEKYNATVLATERLVLAVPPTHELAEKSAVELSEIVDYPYINREKGSGTRTEVGRMLKEAGLLPQSLNVVMELGSTESVITAVSKGSGISILSSIAAEKDEKAGLIKTVKVKGVNSKRGLYILFNPKPRHPRLMELLKEFIEKRAYSKT